METGNVLPASCKAASLALFHRDVDTYHVLTFCRVTLWKIEPWVVTFKLSSIWTDGVKALAGGTN